MAKKKVGWWNWLKSHIDRKTVITSLVTAAVIGVCGAAYNFVPKAWDWYWQRDAMRTNVAEEIRHRIPRAHDHLNDPNLAKKFMDGADPRECLHSEFVNVTVQQLLENWTTAGGEEIGDEIITLAATRNPSKEQMEKLLALLTEEFDGPALVSSEPPKPLVTGATPKILPPPPKLLHPALQVSPTPPKPSSNDAPKPLSPPPKVLTPASTTPPATPKPSSNDVPKTFPPPPRLLTPALQSAANVAIPKILPSPPKLLHPALHPATK